MCRQPGWGLFPGTLLPCRTDDQVARIVAMNGTHRLPDALEPLMCGLGLTETNRVTDTKYHQLSHHLVSRGAGLVGWGSTLDLEDSGSNPVRHPDSVPGINQSRDCHDELLGRAGANGGKVRTPVAPKHRSGGNPPDGGLVVSVRKNLEREHTHTLSVWAGHHTLDRTWAPRLTDCTTHAD